MDFKFISLFICLVSFNAFAVDKALKDKIRQLDKPSLEQNKALVDAATQKADDYDITHVQQILSSPEYQARIEQNNQRALEVMGLSDYAQSLKPDANKEDDTNLLGDRVVLFVSSSMPMDVLRNYARDLDKVGGVMIFKGTLGGIDSIQPTMDFMRSMLLENQNCDRPDCPVLQANVSIDPERFTHHGIDKVPALIFEKDMKIQAYCQAGDKSDKAEMVIYGDASLLGLAQALHHHGQIPELLPIVNRLRGTKS